MPEGSSRPTTMAFDGHTPLQKGHIPTKVQGGYIPKSMGANPTPPSGGSAIKRGNP